MNKLYLIPITEELLELIGKYIIDLTNRMEADEILEFFGGSLTGIVDFYYNDDDIMIERLDGGIIIRSRDSNDILTERYIPDTYEARVDIGRNIISNYDSLHNYIAAALGLLSSHYIEGYDIDINIRDDILIIAISMRMYEKYYHDV